MSDDDPKDTPEVEYLDPKAPGAADATSGNGGLPAGLSKAAESTAPSTSLAAARTDEVKPARNTNKAQERNLKVVQRKDRELRREAQRDLLAILRAPEIDPNDPTPPEGWSLRDWRIARASWNNSREAPSFIAIAEKVYGTFRRAEAQADRDPSPTLNADIQVFVQQNVYHYETVEGDEHK